MEQQMNLFNTMPEKSGYRLQYMEIFNWGTFDKVVYRISPQGNNSLLTGANASGKSTLVDALLTLMVPMKRDRFYNQSSGVEKKGARTEESYVLGCHGTQQEEGTAGTTTLKLRNRSTRSVLLAAFRNAEGKYITLFQVRYFSGQELRAVYGISRMPLTIEEDFAEFDSHGDWRKRLDRKYNAKTGKRIIDFFNGPREYGAQICELFHMRSANALTLFNQIVGVKVLDDLDLFIRHHMLDEQPAEMKYEELYSNFHNLMGAKNNIDKVKEQIGMLKPIDEVAQKLHLLDEETAQLERNKETAAYWFAARMARLAQEEQHAAQGELRRQNEALARLKGELTEVERQIVELNVAIQNDEVSRRIDELAKRTDELRKELERRNAKAREYNGLAKDLALATDPGKEEFDENREQAKAKRKNCKKELKELQEEQRLLKNAEEDTQRLIDGAIDRIRELERNRNNISGRVSEVRNEILAAVGATPAEIPFIGELVRVKEEERDWEAAMERILHNFALRLIVPERYYRAVNEYVNAHNLNGRIVYQRYRDFAGLEEWNCQEDEENKLLQKLEFKPDNRYVEWVKHEIGERYNYACVESLEEFNQYREKAVTREGLIKSVGNKHEKDDRKETRSRENYVLGWENRDKMADLQKRVHTWQEEQKHTMAQLQARRKRQEECLLLMDELKRLLDSFEDYERIDWAEAAQKIQEAEEEKRKLEETDNRAKTLREELEKAQKRKLELEEVSLKTNRTVFGLEAKLKRLAEVHRANLESVQQMGIVNVTYFEQQHEELLEVALEKLEERRTAFQQGNNQLLEKKARARRALEQKAMNLVSLFKRPSPELTDRYKDWVSDVSSLPSAEHIELIAEYQRYYNRLVEEDLLSYQKAFNEYLQENIYTNVNLYKCFFDRWETDIRKAVDQLNESLRGIVFNKDQGTYIQLTATKKLGAEARDFYRLLQEANPYVHEVNATVEERQRHFEEHIEPFMEKLNDEGWRRKVTDVRTWFTYRAEEYFLEGNQRAKTYESMGQLSGGEKAQLTYTILGSAIAYQFGFTKSGLETSFRFIAIDEAFKAQDEDKARYLLDLCHQLHLQLLVVTPSDNIHIVEDCISYVHYVERRGNTSVLYNMPIMEYRKAYKAE